MEVRATENRHWRAPLRGPATEPDTKGRVRCPRCCVRAAEKPLVRARQLGDGAVFSTAAIEPPVAVAGIYRQRIQNNFSPSESSSIMFDITMLTHRQMEMMALIQGFEALKWWHDRMEAPQKTWIYASDSTERLNLHAVEMALGKSRRGHLVNDRRDQLAGHCARRRP